MSNLRLRDGRWVGRSGTECGDTERGYETPQGDLDRQTSEGRRHRNDSDPRDDPPGDR